MPRDDGFAIADVRTTILDDPKIRKLARKLRLDAELACCIMVYLSTLLGSWKEGKRLTADEAESWIEVGPWVKELQAVGLLDASGRIPEASWETHFGPARDRRQRLRDLNPTGLSAQRGGTYGGVSRSGQTDGRTGVPSGPHLGGRRDPGTLDPLRDTLAKLAKANGSDS